MKFAVEFNPHELKDAIMSGTLLALVESIKSTDEEAKTAADIISKGPGGSTIPQNEIPVLQPVYTQPVPTSQPPAPLSPMQPAPLSPIQPSAIVPTIQQTYSLDQLAVAATQLMDAGRRNELVGLLNSFNVPALTALPTEQYGAFATQLRALGAKI